MSSHLIVQKPNTNKNGRPKKNIKIILSIFRQRGEGKTIDQILAAIGDEHVSRGTVAKYVRQFNAQEPSLKKLYQPFEWHRMEQYNLPWEASGFLMHMWVAIQEYWSDLRMGEISERPVTPHQVRWWWRLHQAVPDMENLLDIYLWGEHFVYREIIGEIFGEEPNLSDLEAYIAYKPWKSSESLDRYTLAAREQRIPSLVSPEVEWPGRDQLEVAGALGLLDDLPPPIYPEAPEILPSEIIGYRLFQLEIAAHEKMISQGRIPISPMPERPRLEFIN